MAKPARPAIAGRAADYLALCRVSNLPTVWMNALAAFLLSGGSFSPGRISLLLAGFSMAYCGGMAMNDCLDAAADALSRPDRPMASGRIAPREGRRLCLALFSGALALFWAAGGSAAFMHGAILLGLVSLYNLTHNACVWAVLPMAGCRFMIYLITGAVFSASLPMPLLALAGAQSVYVALLTYVARLEKGKKGVARLAPVPLLLAGIPVLDGVALAFLVGPGWLAAGGAGGLATALGQRRIRGD